MGVVGVFDNNTQCKDTPIASQTKDHMINAAAPDSAFSGSSTPSTSNMAGLGQAPEPILNDPNAMNDLPGQPAMSAMSVHSPLNEMASQSDMSNSPLAGTDQGVATDRWAAASANNDGWSTTTSTISSDGGGNDGGGTGMPGSGSDNSGSDGTQPSPAFKPKRKLPVKYAVAGLSLVLLLIGGASAYWLSLSNLDIRNKAAGEVYTCYTRNDANCSCTPLTVADAEMCAGKATSDVECRAGLPTSCNPAPTTYKRWIPVQ